MKKYLLIFLAALLPFLLMADSSDPRRKYADKYASLAVKEMKRTGVPASITLAQGILESAAGKSTLAVKGNNHFGIKCHNDWRGRRQYYDDDARGECFRVYPSVEASYRDHSDFLRSKDRYKSLFELRQTDYKGWARGLKKAGYATDPGYANKLIDLIEEYELYKYDRRGKAPKATPLQLETPVEVLPEDKSPDIEYSERLSFSMASAVYKQNGVSFVYANNGESYAGIARAHGLFAKEILRFNDVQSDCSFEGGEIVYLAAKKARGPKGVDKYVVDADGETLYGISQRFGIRLASLLKMNPALAGMQSLREGDTVILR